MVEDGNDAQPREMVIAMRVPFPRRTLYWLVLSGFFTLVAACDRQPESASVSRGDDKANEIAKQLESFAPVLVDRLQRMEAPKPDTTDKYTLRGIDLRRTDSVIYPLLGVVRVERSWSLLGGAYFTQGLCFELAPSLGKWKCIKVECKHESGSAGNNLGLSDDRTISFRELVER
jgi:hypothetical protein